MSRCTGNGANEPKAPPIASLRWSAKRSGQHGHPDKVSVFDFHVCLPLSNSTSAIDLRILRSWSELAHFYRYHYTPPPQGQGYRIWKNCAHTSPRGTDRIGEATQSFRIGFWARFGSRVSTARGLALDRGKYNKGEAICDSPTRKGEG